MKLAILALVLSSISLVASIVGIVIPYWTYASNIGATAARGLWHRCDTRDEETIYCFSTYTTVPAYVQAVRAMELIGILLDIVAVCCGILKLVFMKDQDRLPKTAGVSAVAAGACLLIGIVIFAAKFVESSSDYVTDFHFKLSAGFGLCTAAGILALSAGLVYFITYCIKRF